MGASLTVHVLVEVLELERVELIGDGLDGFLLAFRNDFNSWCIPESTSVSESPYLPPCEVNRTI